MNETIATGRQAYALMDSGGAPMAEIVCGEMPILLIVSDEAPRTVINTAGRQSEIKHNV